MTQCKAGKVVWAQELLEQKKEMLAILKEIQEGQEFTPEFCKKLDDVIERMEGTK